MTKQNPAYFQGCKLQNQEKDEWDPDKDKGLEFQPQAKGVPSWDNTDNVTTQGHVSWELQSANNKEH